MRRLLLLGTACALVVTACGAGASPAPRLSNVAARGGPSVHAVAAERKREAGRKAALLLHRVALPPGARRTREPAGIDVLGYSGLGTSELTKFAERHAFWRVRVSLSSVVAFVRSHSLHGFDQPSSAQSGNGQKPVYRSMDFDGPARHGRPMQRMFAVTAVALDGSTVIRVDAGASWVYPRSPREVVPAGVREIDIRDEAVTRRVTDRAKVRRIVRWFNALHVAPPGVHVICGALVASKARFVFRSASGAKLATAIGPSRPGDGCDPILFSIRGHRQPALVDGTFGRRAFVNRVQRLLDVRFPPR
jgi:hypothetical protein